MNLYLSKKAVLIRELIFFPEKCAVLNILIGKDNIIPAYCFEQYNIFAHD